MKNFSKDIMYSKRCKLLEDVENSSASFGWTPKSEVWGRGW